jgi:hypothetical protein
MTGRLAFWRPAKRTPDPAKRPPPTRARWPYAGRASSTRRAPTKPAQLLLLTHLDLARLPERGRRRGLGDTTELRAWPAQRRRRPAPAADRRLLRRRRSVLRAADSSPGRTACPASCACKVVPGARTHHRAWRSQPRASCGAPHHAGDADAKALLELARRLAAARRPAVPQAGLARRPRTQPAGHRAARRRLCRRNLARTDADVDADTAARRAGAGRRQRAAVPAPARSHRGPAAHDAASGAGTWPALRPARRLTETLLLDLPGAAAEARACSRARRSRSTPTRRAPRRAGAGARGEADRCSRPRWAWASAPTPGRA